ncbi:MAG: hypothetical protein ABIN04_07035 [Ginsengibacter sp.]
MWGKLFTTATAAIVIDIATANSKTVEGIGSRNLEIGLRDSF